MSTFNDKVLCSATLQRYTEIVSLEMNCILMYFPSYWLSPPSSQRMDLQAQIARFGPFFLPHRHTFIIQGLRENHDKTTQPL